MYKENLTITGQAWKGNVELDGNFIIRITRVIYKKLRNTTKRQCISCGRLNLTVTRRTFQEI